jgi:hypothetical protein
MFNFRIAHRIPKISKAIPISCSRLCGALHMLAGMRACCWSAHCTEFSGDVSSLYGVNYSKIFFNVTSFLG